MNRDKRKMRSMEQQVKQSALLVIVFSVIAFFIFTLLILIGGTLTRPVLYPNPRGFHNAVVAFELSRTSKELTQVIGVPDSDQAPFFQNIISRNTYIDLVFIPALALTLFAIATWIVLLNRKAKRKFFGTDSLLTLLWMVVGVYILFDYLENWQIFSVLGEFHKNFPLHEPSFTLLAIFTRVKWGSLAFYSIIVGMGYASYSHRISGKIAALFYVTGGLLILFGIGGGEAAPLVEIASLLLVSAWMATWIHAVRTLFFSSEKS